MKLTEAIYNGDRFFYHGSNHDNLIKVHSAVYLTPDINYAFNYALSTSKFSPSIIIFRCHLKKGINICNLQDEIDYNRMEEFFSDIDVSKLKYNDWMRILGPRKREEVIQGVIDLGYDGFFNYEGEPGDIPSAAVGIFDLDNIIIIDRKTHSEWLDSDPEYKKANDRKIQQLFNIAKWKGIENYRPEEDLMDFLYENCDVLFTDLFRLEKKLRETYQSFLGRSDLVLPDRPSYFSSFETLREWKRKNIQWYC